MGVTEQATVQGRTKGQPMDMQGRNSHVGVGGGGQFKGPREAACLESVSRCWRPAYGVEEAEQGEAEPESPELRSFWAREPLGHL